MIQKKTFCFSCILTLAVITILIVGNNIPKTHVVSLYEVHHTIETATQSADTIVVGTVKKVSSPKWNGRNGKEPDINKLILKPTTIEVDQYLKNPQKDKSLQVINIGGTIGNQTVTVENSITFKEGEKVILFLLKDRDPGDGIKYYDPIWNFKVENDNAVNTTSGESIGLTQLQQQIIEEVKS